MENGEYKELYAYYTYRWSLFNTTYTYYFGYKSGNDYNEVARTTSGDTDITVYKKTTTAATPASTTIAITGKTVGTTYITVGGVRYTINVIAENLDKVTTISVE